MRISEYLFRFRRWLLLAIFLIGFWAPWQRMGGAHPGTTWLFLAGLIARSSVLSMGEASIVVMSAAILFALLAALLRTWGSAYRTSAAAYIEHPQVEGPHVEQRVAAGPYRYVCNPLYVGVWLHALALAVLMPAGGALFAVVAVAALNAVNVRAEERHLRAANNRLYPWYTQNVPRFFCAVMPRVPAGGAAAHWGDGFLNEIYMWGVFVTYVAFAGRYNVTILEQGVLISLGVSVVVQGIRRPRALAGA